MRAEVFIRPEAEADIADAFAWYEERVPDLGSQFLDRLDDTLDAIVLNPRQFPLIHREVRRALLHRFPYQVFFLDTKGRIIVLAVFHAKRNPRDWQSRR